MTPQLVAETLDRLAASHKALQIADVGRSYQGRPIRSAAIGVGPRRVLAWSQMHGDEPTHTAVLLDLLAWLAGHGDDPRAAAILAGCTLIVVPMLNPDGAVLGTRENAQGIDVNRDARRLQSPEGRILHDLVRGIRPDVAFNLHNQNARSTVGRSKLPSVVALMTPPVDEADTQSAPTRRAKQIAVCFLDAVQPYCPGMISRYSASYMPRAFGEWVQGTRASTVLVEAGGMPADAAFDMVALHAHGLASTLAAIATGGYETQDPHRYDLLPLDGEIVRFDHVVRGATISCCGSTQPYVADLGINFAAGRRLAAGAPSGGVIEEIGDLDVTTGKAVTDAATLECLPGGWSFRPGTTPADAHDDDALIELLTCGATTVLGTIDASDDQQLAALSRLKQHADSPLNLAFLATWPNRSSGSAEHAALRLLLACNRGACGVLADGVPPDVLEQLASFSLPLVASGQLVVAGDRSGVSLTSSANLPLPLQSLGGVPRGGVAKGAIADLVLRRSAAAGGEIHSVLVGGVPVFADGRFADARPGVLLALRSASS
ncbi:MAG: hypothetical protein KDA44_06445 [Planctomycetales bacterium]|nr:hypothetical protein [Planctomycetales bacterium]